MGHTVANKQKLLNRVRRLKGQIEAVERSLESEDGCSVILQRITAARGAMNSLMAEVLEDHLRMHVLGSPSEPSANPKAATKEVIDVIRTYLR